MRPHGWLGLVVILGGEALLFVRVEPVVTWFTPIAWTGYILLLDAFLAGEGRPTLLTARRREFAAVVPLSIEVTESNYRICPECNSPGQMGRDM